MDPEDSNWVSATVNTLDEKILPYIKNICKRDPLSGKVVTGWIVTVTDSSWLCTGYGFKGCFKASKRNGSGETNGEMQVNLVKKNLFKKIWKAIIDYA